MSAPILAQLFVTCLVDTVFPEVADAVVTVLERAGIQVDFPMAQTCCGQLAFNAGFYPEARPMALQTIATLEASPAPVVIPSGSCAAMIRRHYAELWAHDPPNLARAHALAARVFEFAEFLAHFNLQPHVSHLPRRQTPITYHPACHLTRSLGVTAAPLQLLQQAVGAAYVPLPHADECCGFGGVFAIKHGDISAAILEHKLKHIYASGAQMVVGCDMSCLMHIHGALTRDGSPVQCRHLAETLADAVTS
jgi:L-lactate dehydrogenase complex protein LldE